MEFVQLVGAEQVSVVQKVASACMCPGLLDLDPGFGHAVLEQGCLHHRLESLLRVQETKRMVIEAKYVAGDN